MKNQDPLAKNKDCLTTEDLRKKFRNQFDLVNYAIKLAENMILTGREARVEVDAESRAIQVLEEIAEGKDVFDEILVERTVAEEEFVERSHAHGKSDSDKKQSSKKSRKAFANA